LLNRKAGAMNLVQVDLKADSRVLTCWVEDKVRPGNVVTLKNHESPDLQWKVMRVGEPKDRSQINRGWNNNV